MIHLKTEAELHVMEEGGKRLRRVVEKLKPFVQPGVKTIDIDRRAEEYIIEEGGTSSFKRVPGYHWSTCLPINEQVVHTPPSDRVLKQGDILTLDIGIFYKGYHTDYADTYIVGSEGDKRTQEFLQVGKKTLEKAKVQVRTGQYIGDISQVIEKEIYGHHYFILKDLTGHGIGKELHEGPNVPGYVDKPIEKTFRIRPGLAIAVEIIYSMGTEKIKHEQGDGWSIRTADRSLSACFEDTLLVTEKGTVTVT